MLANVTQAHSHHLN